MVSLWLEVMATSEGHQEYLAITSDLLANQNVFWIQLWLTSIRRSRSIELNIDYIILITDPFYVTWEIKGTKCSFYIWRNIKLPWLPVMTITDKFPAIDSIHVISLLPPILTNLFKIFWKIDIFSLNSSPILHSLK